MASSREIGKDKAKRPAPAREPGRPAAQADAVGRNAIISATRMLLKSVAPSRLTRRDVATHAGVAPALIRYYFNDLPNLLTQVLELMMEDLRSHVASITSGPGTPIDKLKCRVTRLVKFLAENPAFHELFVERVIYGESDWAIETRREFSRIAFNQWNDLIDEGRAAGEIASDFDDRYLYILFIGASEFFTTGRPIFQLLFDEDLSAKSSVDAYAEFVAETIVARIRRDK